MKLSEYKNSDRIFIDANIFLDYSLPNPKYGEIASDFLEKIELNEIKAATTPLVLDEVSFIILIYKGSLILGTKDRKIIINSIKKDKNLSNLCYKVVEEFNEFLYCLKGLQVISVNHEDYKQASIMGKNYLLLPSDALHASVMKNNNIRNIATRDNDFERVEGISVWKP
ncbi:MAG: type II toxin-antitoxin system VapC family toxin [Candidatus Methanoperedens sp.]|nr:type II toxin-antitoxin system VapC family toxin [Candidatus Methanoperedens sp.]